jgi:hypothetical protein
MSKPITKPLDEVEVQKVETTSSDLMLQHTFQLILNNWQWRRLYIAISFIGLKQRDMKNIMKFQNLWQFQTICYNADFLSISNGPIH